MLSYACSEHPFVGQFTRRVSSNACAERQLQSHSIREAAAVSLEHIPAHPKRKYAGVDIRDRDRDRDKYMMPMPTA